MRRVYGGSLAHLLGHLALLALTVYAIDGIFFLDAAVTVFVWLVAAVVFHDAVLWPLYSGADTLGRRRLGAAVNYVRVPLGLSLLLALVFVGTVSGRGGDTYRSVSGLEYDGYVTRWLVVSGGLFLVSGLLFALRRR